jgi:UDP-3-O-[3-hydroxymyristoyl] glucosamine N-acyltransferase
LHNAIADDLADRTLFKPRISRSAQIHASAVVEPNCYIGNNVEISPGAIVLNNSYIEDGAIIGPNVVIGGEGLEFNRLADGKLFKVKHIGGVYVGKHAEVMAGSVIARDVFYGYTAIGTGCKIGPLCNIAHRVKLGPNCCVAGNSTLGGSAKVGRDVWIGPSVTVASEIQIGDCAKLSLGSVVVKDVKPHQTVSGFFAIEHSKALKLNAVMRSKGI